MITIPPEALREGCERAHDLFMLNRLRTHEDAAHSFDAVFQALGIDEAMREQLHDALLEMVPVKGDPLLEVGTAMSMVAGVLVGLLIADSTLPSDELDLPAAAA